MCSGTGCNCDVFDKTKSMLWSKADNYAAHEKLQNGSNVTTGRKKVSTVTAIGRRGNKPVGKR